MVFLLFGGEGMGGCCFKLALLSFSDRNSLHVDVRRRCCCFMYFSRFPESPDQFEQNLAESIFGLRGFKFIQIKGLLFSKGR